ncbi:hypothetical protein B0H13DRAFT_2355303 [Mycena leptocephala]|nr:hypothetical protein B0H13DRAFT_2355303 [Mycena leptocephala]
MNMNVKAEPDQKNELVLISSRQKDPAFIARAAFEQFQRENSGVPRMCTWCGASVDNVQLCRCVDKDCFEGLHSCGPCMVIAHEQRPFHALDLWTSEDGWRGSHLGEIGYVWQRGHDGLPCPNPSPDTKRQLVMTDRRCWYIPMRECLCYAEEREAVSKAKLDAMWMEIDSGRSST